ncbi:T9SS type A sorting domain-containing protein [Chitinophaga varians]|uniref:T9SS type A sorting domain-containing protein n=1 Tax=Chitinophaga varians TaxID=2202339 RepID=A0A847S4V4_9BACT|nr:T9SS type A sorting domain-containing protein [Chitinophaga varians]NLR68108.1 T9SS type A sorting domain-containing protein [Chitinophaga varians]
MKSTILFCFAFFFSLLAHAQLIGETTVCPDTQYPYFYATTRPYWTMSYTVIDGYGNVQPTGTTCYIRFPNDQPKKPRILTRISWADGTTSYDTSGVITVLAIGNPIAYTTMTKSFPCSFRGATTITINGVPRGDFYDVTNDAGWPMTRVSANQFTMDINSGAEGTVTLSARNDSCNRTRSETVRIARPKPSLGAITGPSVVCDNSSQTFTVPPFPDAVSYTWNADNANVRINGQAPPVTTTGAGGNSVQISSVGGIYQASISVTASGECGNSNTTAKTVGTGTPPIDFISGFARNGIIFNGGASYEFSVAPPANNGTILDIEWDVIGGTIEDYYNNKRMIYVRMNNVSNPTFPGSVSMYVKWKNECGWSTALNRTGRLSSSGGNTFMASPNPANNYLNIEMSGTTATIEKTAGVQDASDIILYDMYYKEIKRMKLSHGATRAVMDVQNVKEGTYILQITNGKEKQSKVVIISHSL